MSFDAARLVESFRVCSLHTKDVPHAAFLDGLREVSLLIKLLGTAMGIAAKDIDEKVGILTQRFAELAKRGETDGLAPAVADAAATESTPSEGDAATAGAGGGGASGGAGAGDPASTSGTVRLTLQFMVLDEIRRKVENSNSKAFVSGSRSLLRMMWFLDFVQAMVQNLTNEPPEELKACASAAYDVALAPHHPWLLRKSIGVAMMALPYRENFLKSISGTDDAAAGLASLVEWNRYVIPLRDELWSFYRAHGIQDLP